ncbi:MAG: DUF3237 family protein [Firmicutes bacterium]|nr:DUF3237 family protein [Bacillota bacterium]
MEFNIKINKENITKLEAENGKVTVIPFTGNVESELFTGIVRPGAADVQTTDASGIRHMHAQYIFEGVNSKGEPCHLFVSNNGYFEPGSSPKPFFACPTFMSDDKELNRYLGGSHFRAEGHPSMEGVTIKIFDVYEE